MTPEERAQAKKEAAPLFQLGATLYNYGDFPLALEGFQAAYRKLPTPSILCNIGLVQRSLFRYLEAVDSLKKCVANPPPAFLGRSAEFEKVIGETEKLIVTVNLAVTPTGARVTLDDHELGIAPLVPFKVLGLGGTHVVEVRSDGYEPQRREFVAVAELLAKGGTPGGTALLLKVDLVAIPKTGKVRVTSWPLGAKVSIDGNPMGQTPLPLELEIGGHFMVVSLAGHADYQGDLAISASKEERHLPITLIPLPDATPSKTPLYKRWWLWTGASVVAGGVAAAIAVPFATDHRGALHSTIEDLPVR
jgi:hypothetical protein